MANLNLFTILALLCLPLIPAWLFAERPNVVLIISDDHAWTDYRFLGNEKIQSPHIDQVAAEGLTSTRGYVTTALCSPSLATMLTGLYTHQHGITGNDPVHGHSEEAWLDRFFENHAAQAVGRRRLQYLAHRKNTRCGNPQQQASLCTTSNPGLPAASF